MDLSLTETQLMLRDSARRYLTEALPTERLLEVERTVTEGYDREMWQAMAAMGWMGLSIPEKYGGTGSPLSDVGVLLHEMGRVCLPSPYFDSAVFSAQSFPCLGNQLYKFIPLKFRLNINGMHG